MSENAPSPSPSLLIFNNETNEQATKYSSSFKLINTSLKIKCDLDRIREIHEAIEGNCIQSNSHASIPLNPYSIFPINLADLIKGYEYSNPIEDLYERVMKRLELTKDQEIKLNFNNNDFARQFYSVLSSRLSSREISFSMNDFFWYDLSRLLFKWMIHTRERIAILKMKSRMEIQVLNSKNYP